MFGLIDKLTSIAAFVFGALIGAILSGVVVMFVYEGLSIPFPFFGPFNIIDGRVDKVRKQEQQICQDRIDASVRAAKEQDEKIHMTVIKLMDEDAADDAKRIADQDTELLEYQRTLALSDMSPECGFTQHDLDVLQPQKK